MKWDLISFMGLGTTEVRLIQQSCYMHPLIYLTGDIVSFLYHHLPPTLNFYLVTIENSGVLKVGEESTAGSSSLNLSGT